MNKREHRAALDAKRLIPGESPMGAFNDLLEFTQEQLLAADKAYDAAKTDPAAWDRKIHALHSEEVQMLRILGSAL